MRFLSTSAIVLILLALEGPRSGAAAALSRMACAWMTDSPEGGTSLHALRRGSARADEGDHLRRGASRGDSVRPPQACAPGPRPCGARTRSAAAPRPARKSTKWSIISTSDRTRGRPPTIASMMMPNDDSAARCACRGCSGRRPAPRRAFRSITIACRRGPTRRAVRDALDRLLAHQLGDLLDEPRLFNLVRDLVTTIERAVALL